MAWDSSGAFEIMFIPIASPVAHLNLCTGGGHSARVPKETERASGGLLHRSTVCCHVQAFPRATVCCHVQAFPRATRVWSQAYLMWAFRPATETCSSCHGLGLGLGLDLGTGFDLGLG